jgi:hypothetical protein
LIKQGRFEAITKTYGGADNHATTPHSISITKKHVDAKIGYTPKG